MSKAIVRSVVTAAILSAGWSSAQAADPKTSPECAPQFTAAQTALAAKNYAEVSAKAREALGKCRKPDDGYAANYFLLEVAKAQKNNAGIIEGLEGMLASGFEPGPGTANQFRKALVTANYQQKNFPQAIKFGTDLIKSGGADEDVYTVVGQSYYQTKQYGEAVKLFGGLVDTAEKAGRKPDRRQLTLLQDAYAKAGNDVAAQTTLEKLVRYYPTADTWLVLLYEVKKERLDPRQKLHVYRLMEVTGNLKQQGDFSAYSEAATAMGLPNESNRILDTGLKANAFTQETEKARAQRYLASGQSRVEAARAELPKLEAQAKVAATGNEYVTLGMMHYSFDAYPKAVESLKAGIAKGGLKNAADAQIALGEAQIKAGQKSEAAATFKAIKTDDALTERIAKLWALYASS
jgi:hypothetical protein